MGNWNQQGKDTDKWFDSIGLTNGHGNLDHSKPMPPTYQHSTKGPIDGIYLSPTIQVLIGGYLSFQKLAGDHRGLFLDIPTTTLIGYHMETIVPPLARQLTLDDPCTVKRYNDYLDQYFH